MTTRDVAWTDDDVRELLARYGRAPERLHMEQLPSWWRNLVLRVDADDEKFVLRRYGMTRAAEVEWELELIGTLRAHAFPTIELISMDGTDEVLSSFRERPAVLYRYIEGVPGREVAWEVAAPAAARVVGQLHAITAGLVLRSPRDTAGAEPVRTLQRLDRAALGALEHAPLLRLFIDGARMTVRRVLQRSDTRRARSGVVHHDAHGGNTLFRGDALVGLIDFDDAYEGPLVADVAALIANWAVDAAGRLDAERAGVVLHAYEDVTPLTRSERSLLPDFVLLHALGDALARTWSRIDRGAVGDEALEDNEALLRYRAWRADSEALDALRRVLR